MIRRLIGTTAILVGLAGISPASVALASHVDMHAAWCKGVNPPPQCKTPEAPQPIGLPLAGLAVAGGFAYFVRRHHRQPHSV